MLSAKSSELKLHETCFCVATSSVMLCSEMVLVERVRPVLTVNFTGLRIVIDPPVCWANSGSYARCTLLPITRLFLSSANASLPISVGVKES